MSHNDGQGQPDSREPNPRSLYGCLLTPARTTSALTWNPLDEIILTKTWRLVKRTTPIKKLMDAYCERQGKSLNSLRFLYDGERVQSHNTPAELEMEDGDAIDVMVEQIGGRISYM